MILRLIFVDDKFKVVIVFYGISMIIDISFDFYGNNKIMLLDRVLKLLFVNGIMDIYNVLYIVWDMLNVSRVSNYFVFFFYGWDVIWFLVGFKWNRGILGLII